LHPLEEPQKQSRQHYKDPHVKTIKKTANRFFSAIISKHILGHETEYCFIFSQVLELQPQKTGNQHILVTHPAQF